MHLSFLIYPHAPCHCSRLADTDDHCCNPLTQQPTRCQPPSPVTAAASPVASASSSLTTFAAISHHNSQLVLLAAGLGKSPVIAFSDTIAASQARRVVLLATPASSVFLELQSKTGSAGPELFSHFYVRSPSKT